MDITQHASLTDLSFPQHCLALNDFSFQQIHHILNTANSYIDSSGHHIKASRLLNGVTIANLFFEPSTRTRTAFEIAAIKLGATPINLNIEQSATHKGETLLDTVRNLEAMLCQIFIIRHALSGACHFIAKHVSPNTHIINAGDGQHAHPSQALLDMLTISRHQRPFQELSVAIVGDIKHSRVARSQIQALTTLKVPDIRLVAPKTLLPHACDQKNITFYTDMSQGIQNADVIIMLRLQKERMTDACIPPGNEYAHYYKLNQEKLDLAAKNAIVLHPGPINHGIEIDYSVANSYQSLILKQVTYGIAVRMALFSLIFKQSSFIQTKLNHQEACSHV